MTLHRAMREMAEDYICLRRSLGFKFRDPNQGWLVRDFARNLDDQHVTRVTTQAAAAWATLPSTSLAWHSCRLSVARGFAGYLHALDPVHQVPPADLIPSRYHRPSPCLFSAAGIAALIQAAGTLRPALRAATLQTVIALLATTGIRPGEAVALNREHVDLHNAVLTVASTKFGKSREILLHSTAVAALADYGHLRDRLCPHPVDPGFFVPRPGGPRLNRRQLDYAFAYLAAQAGLRSRSSRCHPAPIGPAAYVRRQHAHQLVPGRRRRRRAPAAAVHLDGTRPARRYLLVPAGGPRTAGAGRRADDPRPPRPRGTTMTSLAPILQGFFTQKMITQKQASPHTVASYRDAFRLLLTYAQQVTGTPPWRMQLSQLDHDLIASFLQHLKTDRGNSAATCNARLAAIHSMFRYAALHAPEDAAVIQRVMAISGSRTTSTDISWLTSAEADALLAAPDRGTWTGRRDHCLILVALRTGLRVSELIQLTLRDVHLDTGPHVRVTGKGRKERCTPLDKPTVAVLSAWLTERAGQPGDPLLCTRRGRPLSPDAIQARLGKYHAIAAGRCPSLADKTLSPHVLRHTTAMTLRISGVDSTVIALYLGHEDPKSTQKYIHADLGMKERALARTTPPNVTPGRYQPPDQLLAYLENL